MSNLKDDFEILDPAEEVQKAYDEANGHERWTFQRTTAARLMGCGILSGLGGELKEWADTGSYDSSIRDVVIVCWLCSLSSAEVIKIIARMKIDQAVQDAFDWAEKEGINYPNPKYIECAKTLARIVTGVFASSFLVERKSESKKKAENMRPLGKSESRSPQSRPRVKQPVTS